jgi:hypothetical protein
VDIKLKLESNIENFILSEKDLPALVLIKNIRLEDWEDWQHPYDIGKIVSGEYIDHSVSIDDLRELIPEAPTPKTKEQEELFVTKHEEIKDYYHFDDRLDNWLGVEERIHDIDIFGVSYSIIWLLPNDLSKIIQTMISTIESELKRGNGIPYVYEEFNCEYIDRSTFASSAPHDTQGNPVCVSCDFMLEHCGKHFGFKRGDETWKMIDDHIEEMYIK